MSQLASATEWKWKIAQTFPKPYGLNWVFVIYMENRTNTSQTMTTIPNASLIYFIVFVEYVVAVNCASMRLISPLYPIFIRAYNPRQRGKICCLQSLYLIKNIYNKCCMCVRTETSVWCRCRGGWKAKNGDSLRNKESGFCLDDNTELFTRWHQH